MELGDIAIDYCSIHGMQSFFLGRVNPNEDEDEWNEALHCPECHPKHPDNPTLSVSTYVEEED
jgi:hypothetical protein